MKYNDLFFVDCVQVRDGENSTGRLIGRYCGGDLPPDITTTSQYMYIKFHSDAATQYTGFRMTYSVNGKCTTV